MKPIPTLLPLLMALIGFATLVLLQPAVIDPETAMSVATSRQPAVEHRHAP